VDLCDAPFEPELPFDAPAADEAAFWSSEVHAAVVEATLPPASLISARKAVELYLPPGPELVPVVVAVPVVVPEVVVAVPEPVVVLVPEVVVPEVVVPEVVVPESGVSVLVSGVSVLVSGVSVPDPEAVPEPEVAPDP